MVKTLYKSKRRYKEASFAQKAQSKLQRKLTSMREEIASLYVANMVRKEQMYRDHNLITIIKKECPEEFKRCLRLYEEKYGKPEKLDVLRRRLRKQSKRLRGG